MHLNHNSSTVAPSQATVMLVYLGLVVIWGAYRAFFDNSIWIEELFIKGFIFLIPIILVPLVDKSPIRAMGITTNNFLKSVSWGIVVGISLASIGVLINYIRFNTFSPTFFSGLGAGQIGAYIILAIITAFWEQLLFSGYFLPHLKASIQKEANLVAVIGILFALIHLPAYIFVLHHPPLDLAINMVLLTSLGAGCAILQLRTKNLIAPIMAHVLWGVTIFIFR